MKTGKDPDSFVYDEVTKRVFIMNSAGNDATAINAVDGALAGTIALDGQPEAAVADGKGKIFVNITDKDQIVEFDAKTLEVLHRWSLAPGEGPSGLAMDRAASPSFFGLRQPDDDRNGRGHRESDCHASRGRRY